MEKEKANRIFGKMGVKRGKMKIKDYDTYISCMRKTYYDKCWWINHIPNNIKYIIDFGCADAGIFEFIDSMFPGRFIYIGVEENEEMLKIAKEKYDGNERVSLYSSLGEIDVPFVSYDTILLLNSVVHELLTYKNYVEFIEFIFDIRTISPAYIAIRDMHLYRGHKLVVINNSKILQDDKFKELLQYSSFSEGSRNAYIEFLLKYFYAENWEREVREVYLWSWSDNFKHFLCKEMKIFDKIVKEDINYPGYSVEYEEDFSIKYLQDKWEKDFGVKIDIPTHKKMLFKRS